MRLVRTLAIVALPLAACQSEAASDRQSERIFAAVRDAMCAETMEDRAVSLDALADEVERYQGYEEDDTASRSVEGATSDFTEADCAQSVWQAEMGEGPAPVAN